LAKVGNSSPKVILDVGCAQGAIGSEFKQNKALTFYGIEPFEDDAKAAENEGYIVFKHTVEAALPIIQPEFDIILAGDVLEHIVNPKEVLGKLLEKLKPDGVILISIPNVANFLVRLGLLFGRFDYTERGILDATHLRFFTRKSFVTLITFENTRIEKLSATPIPVEVIIPLLTRNRAGQMIQSIWHLPAMLFPRFFGYQHLCILKKQDIR